MLLVNYMHLHLQNPYTIAARLLYQMLQDSCLKQTEIAA